MFSYLKNKAKRLISSIRKDEAIESILINQGIMLSKLNKKERFNFLSDYEWKVFSQCGEDGVIDFLVSEIEIANKTFIEFGVEDFQESNCRFLMMYRNWQGFVIDGSRKNISKIKSSYYYWKFDLQTINAFITKENINDLLAVSGFSKDLGVLSIDLDGNDYYILEKINTFSPRIIICEFNPLFGIKREISVPYDPHFSRNEKHYTNLYFGASLSSFTFLLEPRGYTLIGTGDIGVNAYFVRNDCMTKRLESLSTNPINFNFHCRESRNKKGHLSYLRAENRLNAIKGMDVLNVRTGELEIL